MNFSKLLYFQNIAELGRISSAAEKLFVSQSAISKSLHELELELGHELFERRGKRLILNETGKVLLVMVNEILSLIENIKPRLDILQYEKKQLVIDTYYTFASEMMFSILAPQFPSIHFICKRTDKTPSEYLHDLIYGDTDISLISLSDAEYEKVKPVLQKNNINSIILFRESLYLSTPKRAPFSEMRSCKIEDILKMKLIKVDSPLLSNKWFENIIESNKKDIQYFHIFDYHTFMNIWVDIDYPFITTSLFFSFAEYIEGFKKRKQIFIDEPGTVRDVFLLYPEKRTVMLKPFLDFFKEHFYDFFEYNEGNLENHDI